MTARSALTSWTSAPICGFPRVSRTTPLTVPGEAAQAGSDIAANNSTTAGATMENRRFTDSIVYCFLAFAPIFINQKSLDTAALRQLTQDMNLRKTTHFPYSIVNGADCAISCFDTLSFTIIFTRYFPG